MLLTISSGIIIIIKQLTKIYCFFSEHLPIAISSSSTRKRNVKKNNDLKPRHPIEY